MLLFNIRCLLIPLQCREGKGACPDTMVAGANPACTNDVVASSIRGGIRESVQQCVAFSRPLSTCTISRMIIMFHF